MLHPKLKQVCPLRASLCAMWARYCKLPDPIESHEAALRRWHEDLDFVSCVDARAELTALQLWIALRGSPHQWFLDRCERLKMRLRHVQ